MTSDPPPFSVSSLRPKLIFETAAEMVGRSDWPYRNARITLRDQDGEHKAKYTLMGTQSPDVIGDVVRGDVQVAMLNPSAMLTLAVRGTGPFAEPQPLAAIAVIPSDDQFAFAVSEASGITSLAQVAEERRPLRVSIRGAHDPSTALLGNEILRAYGFTLDDIERWGGGPRVLRPAAAGPSAAVRSSRVRRARRYLRRSHVHVGQPRCRHGHALPTRGRRWDGHPDDDRIPAERTGSCAIPHAPE